MLPSDRLSEVFHRAISDGLESLSQEERALYLIQEFILENEMNGLSGYFYNRLSNPMHIASTVTAMRQYGLPDLAALVAEAFQKFEGYAVLDSTKIWSDILRQYDPENRLEALAKKIAALDDYGLKNSYIE